MYIYTTYDIGQTVYFLADDNTVKRTKVTAVRVSGDAGKRETEYMLRDSNDEIDALMEDELFRTPEDAFWSLEPKVEATVYPTLVEEDQAA